jgi:hypothetical protein
MSTTAERPMTERKTPPAAADTCCPVFDPAPWDETMHMWAERRFVKTTIPQALHIPLGLPGRMTRLMRKVEAAGAFPDAAAQLVLMRETSPWRSEILIAVTKEVPGLAVARLSGRFFTKVFDGPYRDTPKWITETDRTLARRGERARRHFVRYAYCPRCARKYGHNHGVVFAELV